MSESVSITLPHNARRRAGEWSAVGQKALAPRTWQLVEQARACRRGLAAPPRGAAASAWPKLVGQGQSTLDAQRPLWYEQAVQHLAFYATLADDFDGQGGEAPSAATLQLALATLAAARRLDCPVAGMAVSGDGTICLEFVAGEVEAELEAYPSRTLVAWVDWPDRDTQYWSVDCTQAGAIDEAVEWVRHALEAC